MGVSSTRVGDHRGSARTVQFPIISLSSPHLRSARARARAEGGQRTWPNSGQSFLSSSKGSTVELVLRLRNLARGLSQSPEYCGVGLLPCGDLAARRRSRRSPHLDLVEDSTQGWQWFCLSSRFDSCAALLSLLSLNMSFADLRSVCICSD